MVPLPTIKMPHNVPLMPHRGEKLTNNAVVLELACDTSLEHLPTLVLCLTVPDEPADVPRYAIWNFSFTRYPQTYNGKYFDNLKSALDVWQSLVIT